MKPKTFYADSLTADNDRKGAATERRRISRTTTGEPSFVLRGQYPTTTYYVNVKSVCRQEWTFAHGIAAMAVVLLEIYGERKGPD